MSPQTKVKAKSKAERQPARAAVSGFEGAGKKKRKFVFILFISGSTEKSVRAVRTIKEILAGQMQGQCELTIIDIYQQPDLVRQYHVVAVPTLVRKAPTPRRFIGDLTENHEIFSS